MDGERQAAKSVTSTEQTMIRAVVAMESEMRITPEKGNHFDT